MSSRVFSYPMADFMELKCDYIHFNHKGIARLRGAEDIGEVLRLKEQVRLGRVELELPR